MKTLFKINNATAQAASAKKEVIAEIKRRCGLTDEAWLNTMFETGCQFVEKEIAHQYFADALLMNSEFGYWDWWVVFYTQHDETLLDYVAVRNAKTYGIEKSNLLSLFEASNQFSYFLKSNRHLNGITL